MWKDSCVQDHVSQAVRTIFVVVYSGMLAASVYFYATLHTPRLSDQKRGSIFSRTLCGVMIAFFCGQIVKTVACGLRAVESNQCDCLCSMLAAINQAVFCCGMLWFLQWILQYLSSLTKAARMVIHLSITFQLFLVIFDLWLCTESNSVALLQGLASRFSLLLVGGMVWYRMFLKDQQRQDQFQSVLRELLGEHTSGDLFKLLVDDLSQSWNLVFKYVRGLLLALGANFVLSVLLVLGRNEFEAQVSIHFAVDLLFEVVACVVFYLLFRDPDSDSSVHSLWAAFKFSKNVSWRADLEEPLVQSEMEQALGGFEEAVSEPWHLMLEQYENVAKKEDCDEEDSFFRRPTNKTTMERQHERRTSSSRTSSNNSLDAPSSSKTSFSTKSSFGGSWLDSDEDEAEVSGTDSGIQQDVDKLMNTTFGPHTNRGSPGLLERMKSPLFRQLLSKAPENQHAGYHDEDSGSEDDESEGLEASETKSPMLDWAHRLRGAVGKEKTLSFVQVSCAVQGALEVELLSSEVWVEVWVPKELLSDHSSARSWCDRAMESSDWLLGDSTEQRRINHHQMGEPWSTWMVALEIPRKKLIEPHGHRCMDDRAGMSEIRKRLSQAYHSWRVYQHQRKLGKLPVRLRVNHQKAGTAALNVGPCRDRGGFLVAEVEVPLGRLMRAKPNKAVHSTSCHELQLMLTPLHTNGVPAPSKYPLVTMYSLGTRSNSPGHRLVLQEQMWESVHSWSVPLQLLPMMMQAWRKHHSFLQEAFALREPVWHSVIEQYRAANQGQNKYFEGLLSQTLMDLTLLEEVCWQVDTHERMMREAEIRFGKLQTRLAAYAEAVHSGWGAKRLSFKPSSLKSKEELEYICTNLHCQMAEVRDPVSGLTRRRFMVSCGAFGAHSLKFKNGNGIWHFMKKRLKLIRTLQTDTNNGVWTPGLQRALLALDSAIRYRLEICFSQMLPAVVTACDAAFRNLAHSGELAARVGVLRDVGMLVYTESLLTAFKAEAGMIADMAGLMQFCHEYLEIWMLPRVHAGHLFEVSSVSVKRNRLECDWLVPSALAQGVSLPSKFRVFPVMLNQGLNEWQTVASMGSLGGDIELQNDVNDANFAVLQSYVDQFCDHYSRVDKFVVGAVEVAVANLLEEVRSKFSRNINMLEITSDLVWLLGGGQIVVCKSGKDRTGMSITHHQSRWVFHKNCPMTADPAQHAEPELADISSVSVFDDTTQSAASVPEGTESTFTLSCLMRGFGTRLENTVKNTGMRGFAFNGLQRGWFPELYRAPKLRCAASES